MNDQLKISEQKRKDDELDEAKADAIGLSISAAILICLTISLF